MSARPSVSFTLRLPKSLHDRLLSVCAAPGSEVTRSGLCVQAIELLLAQLSVCPFMIPDYHPELDKSARQKERRRAKKENCKTGEEK